MDRFDDDTLSAELRALRPTPRPELVHAADGVVLHSQVRSGSSGATGACFER